MLEFNPPMRRISSSHGGVFDVAESSRLFPFGRSHEFEKRGLQAVRLRHSEGGVERCGPGGIGTGFVSHVEGPRDREADLSECWLVGGA